MSKIDDVEKELNDIRSQMAIESGIKHAVRLRCAFVWSMVTGVFGVAGAWASDNVDALKAGFKAFWAVWGQKW